MGYNPITFPAGVTPVVLNGEVLDPRCGNKVIGAAVASPTSAATAHASAAAAAAAPNINVTVPEREVRVDVKSGPSDEALIKAAEMQLQGQLAMAKAYEQA
ncbi:MAG TPA: hypothetical protein VEA59_04680, partial [Patescibacteria group bacterium]|nr:hypothetical protein [Patescibacteria group bacterium]